MQSASPHRHPQPFPPSGLLEIRVLNKGVILLLYTSYLCRVERLESPNEDGEVDLG